MKHVQVGLFADNIGMVVKTPSRCPWMSPQGGCTISYRFGTCGYGVVPDSKVPEWCPLRDGMVV